MLAKKNKKVEGVLLTFDERNIQKNDVQKFNKEYLILKVARINKFNDRFIIIDNKEMYHLGVYIKNKAGYILILTLPIFLWYYWH